MKAICEMAVSAKYDGVIAKLDQALKEKDGLMADKYRMAALNMLGDLVDTSRVDDYIISEIADAASSMDALKNASTFSRLYDAITSDDPRLTFGLISSTWDSGNGDNASVFLTDVLTTPGSTFSNADLSSRMNRAASSQRTADQINNEMNIERWNAVFSAATDAGQQERYASAIDDLLNDRTYEVGNDAIGSAVYAATTIANSYKEKGSSRGPLRSCTPSPRSPGTELCTHGPTSCSVSRRAESPRVSSSIILRSSRGSWSIRASRLPLPTGRAVSSTTLPAMI